MYRYIYILYLYICLWYHFMIILTAKIILQYSALGLEQHSQKKKKSIKTRYDECPIQTLGVSQRRALRRDLCALLKALRPTESLVCRAVKIDWPQTGGSDEIIIKIINRIYKIYFFLHFYMNNSKNGRNRKILYCRNKI